MVTARSQRVHGEVTEQSGRGSSSRDVRRRATAGRRGHVCGDAYFFQPPSESLSAPVRVLSESLLAEYRRVQILIRPSESPVRVTHLSHPSESPIRAGQTCESQMITCPPSSPVHTCAASRVTSSDLRVLSS